MGRNLENKVAIVTGSFRGIGRAIAERLGRDGAKVVVTYHGNQKRLFMDSRDLLPLSVTRY